MGVLHFLQHRQRMEESYPDAETINALYTECICKICQDIKTEPRQLDCGHSSCTLCLRDYLVQYEIENTFSSFIECPECSAHTPTTMGVLTLPRADHLSERIEYLKTMWNNPV